jgi:hypothetical protein
MKEEAEREQRFKEEQKAAKERGETVFRKKRKRRWKKTKSGKIVPKPEVQRNLTDFDARLMKDTQTGSYQQAYNPQIAVDSEAQVIVGTRVSNLANDFEQLVPTLADVKKNVGQMPAEASADKGYFSAAAISDKSLKDVDLYVPPNPVPNESGVSPEIAAVRSSMREKLSYPDGKKTYKKRNTTVEPVFAHIKHVRGYRQFLLRGLEQVEAEWALICMTHNLLKMFKAGKQLEAI